MYSKGMDMLNRIDITFLKYADAQVFYKESKTVHGDMTHHS